nr:TatD family hydrolase [Buchnera aphidicola]
MYLIDTHCHINRIDDTNKPETLDYILKKAYANNIKLFLSVSTSIEDFYNVYKYTYTHKNILLSCGLHPNDQHTNNDLQKILSLSKKKKLLQLEKQD